MMDREQISPWTVLMVLMVLGVMLHILTGVSKQNWKYFGIFLGVIIVLGLIVLLIPDGWRFVGICIAFGLILGAVSIAVSAGVERGIRNSRK